MSKLNIPTPKDWRMGQTIFNFLWWLQEQKGYASELDTTGRMADPFHISDSQLQKLYKEFIKQHKTWKT